MGKLAAANLVNASLPANPFALMAYIGAALLIVNHFGRPFESFLVGLKLPAFICGTGIFLALFSGAPKTLKSRIGLRLSLFISWVVITVPFSNWKGGSAGWVLWYVEFWVTLVVLVAWAPRTPRQTARLVYITAAACAGHLIFNGGYAYGRYALSGTFGNSDDVALMAGYTIPFIVLAATQLRNPVVRTLLLVGGVGYMLLLIGRTATRAAIPAVILMVGVYFWRAKGIQRVQLIAGSVISLILLPIALPSSSVERLATIFDSFDSDKIGRGTSEAMDSVAERRELLRDALSMIAHHPIFGVGAGEFLDYRIKNLKNPDGSPKRYFPSHNTYLNIAAETGIVGVLLYVVFLYSIFSTIRKTRKMNQSHTHPEAMLISQIQLAVEAALVYFSTCAIFMTCDRHPHQFVLAGIALSLEYQIQHWLKQSPAVGSGGPTPLVPASPLLSQSSYPPVTSAPFAPSVRTR
jgi:O-antigen ligase